MLLLLRDRRVPEERGDQMHLIAVREPLGRVRVPAVDQEQNRILRRLNPQAGHEVGHRALNRERHIKTTQHSRRRLPLERRVEMHGHYQLILRFQLTPWAGRLARIAGRQVLRMTQNPMTRVLYERAAHALGV